MLEGLVFALLVCTVVGAPPPPEPPAVIDEPSAPSNNPKVLVAGGPQPEGRAVLVDVPGVNVQTGQGVAVDAPFTNVRVGPKTPEGRQVNVRAGPVGVYVDPANPNIGKPFQFAFDLPKIVSVGVRSGGPGNTGVLVNLPILDFLKGLFQAPPPPPPGTIGLPPPPAGGPPPVYLKPQDENIDVGAIEPNLIKKAKT